MMRLLHCAAMTRFDLPHLPWWLMSNVIGDRVFVSEPHDVPTNQVNTYFIPGFCEWPGVFGKMKEFFRGRGRNIIDADRRLHFRPMIESASAIEELIRSHLGDVPVHEIIGHSRGALLALYVAKKLNIPNVALLAPPLNGAPLAWLLPWAPSAKDITPSPIFSSFIDALFLDPMPARTIIVQGGRDGFAPDHYLARLPIGVTTLYLPRASHVDLVRRLDVFRFLDSQFGGKKDVKVSPIKLRAIHTG